MPLGNQSVLLRGVNDDAEIMKALVHRPPLLEDLPNRISVALFREDGVLLEVVDAHQLGVGDVE